MSILLTTLKVLGKSCLDLIYPPICFHCNETLEANEKIFCEICLFQLDMIDPSTRCSFCFSSEFDPETQKSCRECEGKPRLIQRMASVFDYEGAPSTLVKQLKYGGKSFLAIGGGAYLAAQFCSLNWPTPDLIIPMPMSRLRRWDRGYNQSALLAEGCAACLGCPVSNALRRKSGDFSQAGMDHEQRLTLKNDSFFVQNKEALYGKSLLLIDDVMTTGTSLNCCAEVLASSFPKAIYALTLCRTI
jgi:competence protein ComFC